MVCRQRLSVRETDCWLSGQSLQPGSMAPSPFAMLSNFLLPEGAYDNRSLRSILVIKYRSSTSRRSRPIRVGDTPGLNYVEMSPSEFFIGKEMRRRRGKMYVGATLRRRAGILLWTNSFTKSSRARAHRPRVFREVASRAAYPLAAKIHCGETPSVARRPPIVPADRAPELFDHLSGN